MTLLSRFRRLEGSRCGPYRVEHEQPRSWAAQWRDTAEAVAWSTRWSSRPG